jgi:hypothetical protein
VRRIATNGKAALAAIVITAAVVLSGCGATAGAQVDGVSYAGLEQAKAADAYVAGYESCYVSSEMASASSDSVVAFGDIYAPVLDAGCSAANADINACVPPINYNNGGAYYCLDHGVRRLVNLDGSSAPSSTTCSWVSNGWRCA